MGITYSTKNYEKIINIIEEPYLGRLTSINPNLIEAVNIDNNNRKMVYKHKTRDYYLLYVGGICNVSQCFEVNENFLLRESHQFSTFYALKDFVIKHYPKSELILEIIKYESKHYIDIIDLLERGEHKEIIINFSDSESTNNTDSSDSSDSSWSDIEEDIPDFNPEWSDNKENSYDFTYELGDNQKNAYDFSPVWSNNREVASDLSPIWCENVNDKKCLNSFNPVWSNIEDNKDINNFNATWTKNNNNSILNYSSNLYNNENTLNNQNIGWIYNDNFNKNITNSWSSIINNNFHNINETSLSKYYKNVNCCLEKSSFLNECLDNAINTSLEASNYTHSIAVRAQNRVTNKSADIAVDISKESATYAFKIANECEKIIESINNYEKKYLDTIEEEINKMEDSSDEDIILPNMNYFKS